jgi:hypothetical protein
VSVHGSKPSCLWAGSPPRCRNLSFGGQATVWRTTPRHANRQKSSNFMFVMANQDAQLRLASRSHGTLVNRWSSTPRPLSPVFDLVTGIPGVDLEQHQLSLAFNPCHDSDSKATSRFGKVGLCLLAFFLPHDKFRDEVNCLPNITARTGR